MTLDQAITKVASDLDCHLERLNDQSWLRMISSGMDEDAALDLLDYMREANTVARANTLIEIRAMLAKEFSA